MKKRIIISSSIFLVFICILAISNFRKKTTFFSDYILNVNNKNDEYNYSFSNNNLTSDLLLEYLDYNAQDLKNNIKINDLIKKSKEIYISVGMNDLLQYVSINDNKLSFNPTIISEKMALLEYNIFEIINSILAIKEVKIFYFSLYYLNDVVFDEFINEYNYEIKELLIDMGANYIELNDYVKIENYQFTEANQKKVYQEVIKH